MGVGARLCHLLPRALRGRAEIEPGQELVRALGPSLDVDLGVTTQHLKHSEQRQMRMARAKATRRSRACETVPSGHSR
jgi:hypothetical protein